MKKLVIFAMLIATLFTLTACGSDIEGTYKDKNGFISYTFESGGVVYVSTMGGEAELEYTVDEDKIKIISPQGKSILRLKEDGSLSGPMGIKLTKQQK